MEEQEFSSLGQIFQTKKKVAVKKPPAYPWQDLALNIINELGVPSAKRNSVFQVCKKYSREQIERALNDTKELCKSGERWKYFFKVIAGEKK
jgi:hypothetical protein